MPAFGRGNQEMARLFRSARSPAPPALPILPPTDPCEFEADRVADAVMRSAGPPAAPPAPTRPAPTAVRLKCRACEDETLHRTADGPAPAAAPAAVHDVLASPGRPLDASARAFFEPRFGADLSAVRVHDGAAAAASADAVAARAYAVGGDVVFAAGEYAPHTDGGRRLLAHELAHVLHHAPGVAAVRRYSWEEFKSDAGEVVDDGKAAAGQAWDGVKEVASDVKQTAGDAWQGAKDTASDAWTGAKETAGGVVDWITTKAGDLALKAANKLAQRYGGSVVRSPDGGIDVLLPSVTLMKVQSETRTLPLGINADPLQATPVEVGPFVVNVSLGTVFGDPTGTLAYGPILLQNAKLHLDPFGSTYAGSAEVTAGAGLSGSVENAQEVRAQAIGVIYEVPVEATAAVGSRVAYRVIGKGHAAQAVSLTYRDGEFQVDLDTDVQLGVGYEVDLEAFAKLELESYQVCEVVWPFQSRGDGLAFTANVPLSLHAGKDGSVTAVPGDPTLEKFPFAAIVTPLVHGHAPPQCLGLEDIARIYCERGKLPPSVCAILAPGGPKAADLPGGMPFAPTIQPDEPAEPQGDPCAGFPYRTRAPGHSTWTGYVVANCGGSKDGVPQPHGHHIVMKGDGFSENAQARAILCKYGIDPFVDCANLVVSPNKCHSQSYATRVLKRLQQADRPGATPGDIVTALRQLAQVHAACPEGGQVDPGTDE